MGDMAEGYRDMRVWAKQRQQERYQKNLPYIKKVTGFVVTELTPYQFRFFAEGIGDFMDLYPTNQRFHNLITGERGYYKTAQGFLNLELKLTKEHLAAKAK